MITRLLSLAVLAIAATSCVVTETSLPKQIVAGEEINFSVRMDSIITYGSTMNGAPTLCISAPEDWEVEALSFKGIDKDGVIEGTPRPRRPMDLTFQPPEGYVITCWEGKFSTYTLTSHGKGRLRMRAQVAQSAEITFISGYDDSMNYYEHTEQVEVISAEGSQEDEI